MPLGTILSDNEILNSVYNSSTKTLNTGATVTTDIQIGAVEIKDATTDTRAVVSVEGLAVRTNVPVTIGDGSKTVTTAGTAVALAASTISKRVTVTAGLANTGVICVGGSTVLAAAATRRGTPLNAGNSVTIEINNLSKVFIDATVGGEGVTYSYVA